MVGLTAGLGPAGAVDGWSSLSQDDRNVLQMLLEHETTNTPRPLPSGIMMVVTRTETSPAVCRWFTLSNGAVEVDAQACRHGPRQWMPLDVPRGSRPVAVAAARPPAVPAPPATPTAPASPAAAGGDDGGVSAGVLSAREQMRRLLIAQATDADDVLDGATPESEAALDDASFDSSPVTAAAGPAPAPPQAVAAAIADAGLDDLPLPRPRPTLEELSEAGRMIQLAEAPDAPLPPQMPTAPAAPPAEPVAETVEEPGEEPGDEPGEATSVAALDPGIDVPLPTRRPEQPADLTQEAEPAEDAVEAEEDIPMVRLAEVPVVPAPRLRPTVNPETGRALVRLDEPPTAPLPSRRPVTEQGSAAATADATAEPAAIAPRQDGADRVSAATDAPALAFGPAAGPAADGRSAVLRSLGQATFAAEAGPGMAIEVHMVVLDEPPEVPVPDVHPLAANLPADRLDPAPDAPLPPRRPNAG